jgi:AcrR family transcriptional regulator
MTDRVGDLWTLGHDRDPAPDNEGLRERKKRLMRQQLSDVATAMFLERGFDAVRVAEVAEACGVSEKTVYNYFPHKESLLLDREEAMTTALRGALETGSSPVEAVLALLEAEVHSLTSHFAAQQVPREAVTTIRKFADLIEGTPSVRAHQRDMMERLVVAATEALAERAGLSRDDPEPQIAASSLLGLWRVQFSALERYGDGSLTPAQIRERVNDEVRRAARLIETGLWSLGPFMSKDQANQRDELAVSKAAEATRTQVIEALTEARRDRGAFGTGAR